MTKVLRFSAFPCSGPARSVIAALAFCGLLAFAAPPPQAQTLTVIYSFQGGTDGATPQGSVIRDSIGNLYGTAEKGGDLSCNPPYGCGVVFKLDSTGTETILHTFEGGTDGMFPWAGLVADISGNLYGTTLNGGDPSCSCGTVFKVAASGGETVLYSFKGGTDGEEPIGGVVLDAKGNLYGTTDGGGGTSCFGFSCGTAFKLDQSGKETILHAFRGGTDGSNPWAGLTWDHSGNLYGTTYIGGDTSCDFYAPGAGCGTVFELKPNGEEIVLYSFRGGADGALVLGGVTRDAAGNLYGTTVWNGAMACNVNRGCGTVFKVDPSGNETVLHTFTRPPDGGNPSAGVVLNPKGRLYGVTGGGGRNYAGAIFAVNGTNQEVVLHSFSASTDGDAADAPLTIDSGGNLYGTAAGGGLYDYGTVFKFIP